MRPPTGLQVAAVSETGQLWTRRVVNLALSLAHSPTSPHVESSSVVWIGQPNARSAGLVRAIGLEPIVELAVRPHSPLNKIRMFERADPELPMAALDCDLLIDGNLAAGFDPGRISAVPAEFPFLPAETWRRLYRTLGLRLLDRPLISTVSHEPIPVPYLNSGVLLLPGRWCSELAAAWTEYARDLDHHPDLGPWDGLHDFLLEQVALACAISRLGLPLAVLPTAFNLPFRVSRPEPVVALHYHRRMRPDGTIETPVSVGARSAVDRFNTLLRHTGLAGPFEG